MKENGQPGIVNEEYAQIGDNNFRTTIAKLKSQNVEAVFLDMVGNDPINFLVQSKQLGFNPKIISYNSITDSFSEQADKSLLEGVVILNWEVSSKEFIKLYKTVYGIEPTKSAEKYFDAVYVLANSIANSVDQTKVAEYISKNEFTTPNGVIRFTADHAVENVPVKIQVIKDGMAGEYKL
jgi:ABC-type branched-subunit amino acid transport system substrate-binding protein